MSGKRFQSRAKTVQKLGRDGLVEQNMATGEEKRVSQRTADISFGPARPQEQAAGHRAAQRSGGDSASSGKKRRKQPRPVQQTAEEAAYATPEPASVPEAPMPVLRLPPLRRTAAPTGRRAVQRMRLCGLPRHNAAGGIDDGGPRREASAGTGTPDGRADAMILYLECRSYAA